MRELLRVVSVEAQPPEMLFAKPPSTPPTRSPIPDQFRSASLVAFTKDEPTVAVSPFGTALRAASPFCVNDPSKGEKPVDRI